MGAGPGRLHGAQVGIVGPACGPAVTGRVTIDGIGSVPDTPAMRERGDESDGPASDRQRGLGRGRTGDAPEDGRSYWERHARAYGRSLAILGKPLPRVIALVREAVNGAGEVLEVAAGTGVFTIEMAPDVRQLVATDYSEAMIELLLARVTEAGLSNVVCVRADIYSLPFEPARFDAVVAGNVLHLVQDLPGALRALRRVLRPGGRLVVPTFCHDETGLSSVISRVLALTGFPGRRRFTSRSLRAELEKAGLRIDRQETVAGLIPMSHVDGVFSDAAAHVL